MRRRKSKCVPTKGERDTVGLTIDFTNRDGLYSRKHERPHTMAKIKKDDKWTTDASGLSHWRHNLCWYCEERPADPSLGAMKPLRRVRIAYKFAGDVMKQTETQYIYIPCCRTCGDYFERPTKQSVLLYSLTLGAFIVPITLTFLLTGGDGSNPIGSIGLVVSFVTPFLAYYLFERRRKRSHVAEYGQPKSRNDVSGHYGIGYYLNQGFRVGDDWAPVHNSK